MPFVDDSRIEPIASAIEGRLGKRPSHLRLVGLSGIGKTHLCMEAMPRVRTDSAVGRPIQDFAMYAALSEVCPQEAFYVVNCLGKSGGFAVVVMDNCDASAHRKLKQMALHKSSGLLLITICDDAPSTTDLDIIRIEEAPAAIIKGLVGSIK